MRLIRHLASRFHRIPSILKARKEVSRLYGQAGAVSKSLSNALRTTLEDDITLEEKSWIDRIESLRKELNSSTTEISMVDYGAGSSDLDLTDEQMYQGRLVTRTISDISRSCSKPYLWCLLLFKLIREFRPSVCVELGTCLGVSACYQAAALKLNQRGKIITLEGAESLASLAKQNVDRAKVNPRPWDSR